MYRPRGRLNGERLAGSERLAGGERPLGCWQVLGVLAVTLLAFLLFYEPIINLAR